MIEQGLVERIREAADLVEIIGEHVKLKRAGADFRGACPFHGGKNPNFSVSPRRGMYHCFKCGESGNAFTFLQKHLGMSFPEAVRYVAALEGIEVPEHSVEREGPDPREPFWEVNATAAEYFRTQLWDEPGGQVGRDYLDQRGISREVADKYVLGYAPREIGVFRAHMATLGFDEDRLLEAGLLSKHDEHAEPRPRFRHRLMFPILDASGRYIAFGGRALGDIEPKYLNSPETPVFSKSKTLYALNWTKNDIRKEDRVCIVEGYFDAIRLMVTGFNIAVAPLGTALTEGQVSLLARYTKNVYLMYDSDQAGLKATFRAGDELLKQSMSVHVVTFPGGEDPDTFLRSNGAAAMEQQISQSVDIFERKIQILERGGWFAELQKTRRALDRLLPTIRVTADALLQDLYITRAAEKTGIAKDVLLREVASRDKTGRSMPSAPEPEFYGPPDFYDEPPTERRATPRREGRKADGKPRHNGPGVSSERELLRAILADPNQILLVAERIGVDQFHDVAYRTIFETMLEMVGEDDEFNVERLAEHLEPQTVNALNELLAELDSVAAVEPVIRASIAQLTIRDLTARSNQIQREMSIASEYEKNELMKEKLRLSREIELLEQPINKRFKFFTNPPKGPR